MKKEIFSTQYSIDRISEYFESIRMLGDKWEEDSIKWGELKDGTPFITDGLFEENGVALKMSQTDTATARLMTHVDYVFKRLPFVAILKENGGKKFEKIKGRDFTFWMSITPMEMQSQEQAILACHGDVGIGGLGMGYAALRIANDPKVDKLTIYEIDQQLIDFVSDHLIDFDQYPKISIVKADVKKLKGLTHDVFFNDIYEHIGDPNLLVDWRTLTRENSFGEYWAWSQELFLTPYQEFKYEGEFPSKLVNYKTNEIIDVVMSRPMFTGRINPETKPKERMGEFYDFLMQGQPYFEGLAGHFEDNNCQVSDDGFIGGIMDFSEYWENGTPLAQKEKSALYQDLYGKYCEKKIISRPDSS